jgi:hypothetical protein
LIDYKFKIACLKMEDQGAQPAETNATINEEQPKVKRYRRAELDEEDQTNLLDAGGEEE